MFPAPLLRTKFTTSILAMSRGQGIEVRVGHEIGQGQEIGQGHEIEVQSWEDCQEDLLTAEMWYAAH